MKRPAASLARPVLISVLALFAAVACGDSDETGGPETTASGDTTTPEGQTSETTALAEDWPTEPLRLLVAASTGGGTDTYARLIAPHWEEELGTSFIIENHPGGGTQLATSMLVNEGDECSVVLFTGFPHFEFTYLAQEAPYDKDDLAPVGTVQGDVGVLIVANDAPWQTLEELIEDATARPGEIRASVSTLSSPNYLALLGLQDATGAEFNTVPFDGGGPARNAVLSGEVDISHANVYNHQSVAADTRVLAVWAEENLWPDLTDDAPTVSEALGTEVAGSSTLVGSLANASCRDQHPGRYQSLVEALERATSSSGFQESMEGDGALHLGPDALQAVIDENHDSIVALLDRFPELAG